MQMWQRRFYSGRFKVTTDDNIDTYHYCVPTDGIGWDGIRLKIKGR